MSQESREVILMKFLNIILDQPNVGLGKTLEKENLPWNGPSIDLVALRNNNRHVNKHYELIEQFCYWLKQHRYIKISELTISDTVYDYTNKGRNELERMNYNATIKKFLEEYNG